MKENTVLSQKIFEELEKRIGREHLGKRLRRQVKHSAIRFGDGSLKFHWENFKYFYIPLRLVLRSLGLLNRGMVNALVYQVEEKGVHFRNLPKGFRGFRILQLTDLHIDGIADNGKRLRQKISELDFDLCVVTGDFRFFTFADYDKILPAMENLMDALQCEHGVFGILGNHDFIEMVPRFESIGIKMLLNEAAPIKRDDEMIWIAGVDDPHFYEVHSLTKAFQEIPHGAFKILLAHSPEIIKDAAHFMVDYYLCGHTHGGQICFPGGIPILTNAACSRKYVSGSWKYMEMKGYTSRGTGSSGLAVRFFCPPEITLHRFV